MELQRLGWRIIFFDPGRASRGGEGDQGAAYRVFERDGFRIPDVVGAKDGRLLLVEIDSTYPKTAPSLESYRSRREALLSAITAAAPLPAVGELEIGFCRTGTVSNAELAADVIRAQDTQLALIVVFTGPRAPRLFWELPSPTEE
jgi:hypothetical protein